jgi:hypothetical protein
MGLSYHTFNTHKVLPQLTKLNNRLPTVKYGNQEWTQKFAHYLSNTWNESGWITPPFI